MYPKPEELDKWRAIFEEAQYDRDISIRDPRYHEDTKSTLYDWLGNPAKFLHLDAQALPTSRIGEMFQVLSQVLKDRVPHGN